MEKKQQRRSVQAIPAVQQLTLEIPPPLPKKKQPPVDEEDLDRGVVVVDIF